MSLASAKQSIATTGAKILRPFHYAASFIQGTLKGTFDGMANWGRKGFWSGLGFGIFAGIAGGALMATALPMAIGGLAIAGVAGAVVGGLRGGFGNVSREHRRDKYASEVAERQAARTAREARQPVQTVDHRESYARRTGAANYNFERQLQQERENDRDYGTYWQDRMEASRGAGNGRGF